MSGSYQVLDAEQMRRRYGAFYSESPKVPINPHRVPEVLHALIPYAEFWGITDDWARENIIAKAPHDIQDDLKEAIASFDDELDNWLAGAESDSPLPSQEYVAFSAMRMAADFA
jgi:hypothetical protein